jgi:hypothetical protein
MVAIVIAGVLKENRNTLVKKGRLTYLCFSGTKTLKEGDNVMNLQSMEL